MTTPNRDREALEAAPDIELKVSRSRSSLLVGERIDVEVVAPSNLRKQAERLAAFFNHFSPTRVRALLDERDAMLRELQGLWSIAESWAPDTENRMPSLAECKLMESIGRLRDARETKR